MSSTLGEEGSRREADSQAWPYIFGLASSSRPRDLELLLKTARFPQSEHNPPDYDRKQE